MSDAMAVVRGMIAVREPIRGQNARQEADALARVLAVAEAAVAEDTALKRGAGVTEKMRARLVREAAVAALRITEPTDE